MGQMNQMNQMDDLFLGILQTFFLFLFRPCSFRQPFVMTALDWYIALANISLFRYLIAEHWVLKVETLLVFITSTPNL